MRTRGVARRRSDRAACHDLVVPERHACRDELAEVPVGGHLRRVTRRVGRAEHERARPGRAPEHGRGRIAARRMVPRVVHRLPDRDDDIVERCDRSDTRLEPDVDGSRQSADAWFASTRDRSRLPRQATGAVSPAMVSLPTATNPPSTAATPSTDCEPGPPNAFKLELPAATAGVGASHSTKAVVRRDAREHAASLPPLQHFQDATPYAAAVRCGVSAPVFVVSATSSVASVPAEGRGGRAAGEGPWGQVLGGGGHCSIMALVASTRWSRSKATTQPTRTSAERRAASMPQRAWPRDLLAFVPTAFRGRCIDSDQVLDDQTYVQAIVTSFSAAVTCSTADGERVLYWKFDNRAGADAYLATFVAIDNYEDASTKLSDCPSATTYSTTEGKKQRRGGRVFCFLQR